MPCQDHCFRACLEVYKLGYKLISADWETIQVHLVLFVLLTLYERIFKFTGAIRKSSKCGKINCFECF